METSIASNTVLIEYSKRVSVFLWCARITTWFTTIPVCLSAYNLPALYYFLYSVWIFQTSTTSDILSLRFDYRDSYAAATYFAAGALVMFIAAYCLDEFARWPESSSDDISVAPTHSGQNLLDHNATGIPTPNASSTSPPNDPSYTLTVLVAVLFSCSITQVLSACGCACTGYMLHTITARLAMIIQERAAGAIHLGLGQGMSPRTATVAGMRVALGQYPAPVAVGQRVFETPVTL